MSTLQLDPRNITCGREIPSEGYCDQPYLVVLEDGTWLCVMTTGRGTEGEPGQHVISTRSADRGKTWSEPVDIEPADGPEASWAMPLLVPSGRVYVFYTYNSGNLREVKADEPPFEHGLCRRVDSLGAYAYKFSDDGGRSWSAGRWEIPMRKFDIDLANPYGGELLFFWGVGKPFIHDGAAYVCASKVGGFGEGFFTRSEGMLLRSDNLLTERDPSKHRWETLPEGQIGLRAPKGPIGEEHNATAMNDGSLYCTYRTTAGFSAHAYSRDGGRTWTRPEFMTYTPGGRRVKNPRAANFVRRFSNGKYVYWFHNHGGEGVFDGADASAPYRSRNPAWLCGGVEKNGLIHWSQPEIVLYDDDPEARISYPDFIEDGGRYFITETQKDIARVHEIDSSLLEAMWNQANAGRIVRDGLALELSAHECNPPAEARMPVLGNLSERGGFTIDLRVVFNSLAPSQVLFDSRDDEGKGIALTLTDRGTVRITLVGGTRGKVGGTRGCRLVESAWECDDGLIRPGKTHQLTFIVDGGPKIITTVVDGVLCDGGEARQYGWGRFDARLSDVNGAPTAHVAPALDGALKSLRIYNRRLLTSEAVANFRAET